MFMMKDSKAISLICVADTFSKEGEELDQSLMLAKSRYEANSAKYALC